MERTGNFKVSLILGGPGSTFCVLVLSLWFIPFCLGAEFKHFYHICLQRNMLLDCTLVKGGIASEAKDISVSASSLDLKTFVSFMFCEVQMNTSLVTCYHSLFFVLTNYYVLQMQYNVCRHPVFTPTYRR